MPLLLLCKKQGLCPGGAIRKEKQNVRKEKQNGRTFAVWMKLQLLKIKIWAFIDSPLSYIDFSQCTSLTVLTRTFFAIVKKKKKKLTVSRVVIYDAHRTRTNLFPRRTS